MATMNAPYAMSVAALICYGAAEAFAIAHMRWDRRVHGTITTVLLVLGFLVQFASLQFGARAIKAVPYHDLPASMSLFAWMIIGAYGVLLLTHRESSTGPFLLPLAIVFLGVSLLAPPSHAAVADPRLSGSLFAFHVTIAIFGYSALSLAFVLAQLYLIQTRQLHRRNLGILFSRLPALDVLSRLHRTCVTYGVVALTIASTLGLIWAKRNWGTYGDPKVLFTFLIIAIYLTTLLAPRLGWGGRRVAFLSIGGFVLLVFSYTIVNLFISLEHVFR